MASPKFSSTRNIGLGIVALSIIALIVSFNENNFTLNDLEIMEGKVTDVRFVKGGKYAYKIVALDCQFDNGRSFSIPGPVDNWKPEELSSRLKGAGNVKIWLVKDYSTWETLVPQQISIDDMMYLDFKDKHSSLPENFWIFCIALVVGAGFVFIEPLLTSVIKQKA